jgi:hypothetical protein
MGWKRIKVETSIAKDSTGRSCYFIGSFYIKAVISSFGRALFPNNFIEFKGIDSHTLKFFFAL